MKLLGYEKRYVEYTTADDISFIPVHRPLAYLSPERLVGGREEEDQLGDQFCLAECLWTWIAGETHS